MDFIKDKEQKVKSVLPQLKQLDNFKKESTRVEVFRGEEGFRKFVNDILRTGKDIIAFGVDDADYKEHFPLIMEKYYKQMEKQGLKERLITSEKARYQYRRECTEYRYVPEEFFSPTSTAVFGNKIVITIWDPLIHIMIESAELAESYKKHFELLWNMAKKKKKS